MVYVRFLTSLLQLPTYPQLWCGVGPDFLYTAVLGGVIGPLGTPKTAIAVNTRLYGLCILRIFPERWR